MIEGETRDEGQVRAAATRGYNRYDEINEREKGPGVCYVQDK